MIRAFVVDDEQPAVDRLSRMLAATGRVQLVGASTDPVEALAAVSAVPVDVLFLDVRMPEVSGLELAAQLRDPPLLVFTTAYDEHALAAFDVNAIDYLLKPIEPEQLDRALAKAGRFIRGAADCEIKTTLFRIAAMLQPSSTSAYLTHLASRTGDRVKVIDLREVTHIFAEHKVTFAATLDRSFAIDRTIVELEQRLDPSRFVRISRRAILNLDYVLELHAGFAGRLSVLLKDSNKTELTVSRARVRSFKARLGL